MMKSLHLLFLCALATALFLCFLDISSSSPVIFPTGSRSMREMQMSSLYEGNGHKESKVDHDEPTKQTAIPEDFPEEKYPSSRDHPDELVYHIDYHSATTHPTPTPKHPRP